MRINMEATTNLVQQAKNGDVDAFSKLYSFVYEDLYRFAFYTLKNQEDACDTVSDTVLAAFSQIKKLRDPSLFKHWIFKILSNQCKRKLKEYTKKTVELPDDLGSYEQDFTEGCQLRMAFTTLSSEERLILSLHQFAGYNSKEIGSILHMPSATVRTKEHRALKKLEQAMHEQEVII